MPKKEPETPPPELNMAQPSAALPQSHPFPQLIRAINFLSFFLSFVYICTGFLKLSGKIYNPIDEQLSADFERYRDILHLSEIGMDSVSLRMLIGIHEVFLAVGILTVFAIPCAAVLIVIMAGACYVHYQLGESFNVPLFLIFVLLALIGLRLRLKSETRKLVISVDKSS